MGNQTSKISDTTSKISDTIIDSTVPDSIVPIEDGVLAVELVKEKEEMAKVKNLPNFDKSVFKISHKDIRIFELAENGSSNDKIFKTKYKGEKVSMKVLHSDDFPTSDCFDAFTNAINIHAELNHENISKFIGAGIFKTRIGLLYERVPFQVKKLLLDEKNRRFTIPERLKILLGVANGMDRIHEKDVTHGDLCWSNIMITGDLVPKIQDVGLSKRIAGSSMKKDFRARGQYQSPEECLGMIISQRGDVFAFGIMMYELITGNFEPYGSNIEYNLPLKVALNPDFRPKIEGTPESEQKCLDWVFKLMKTCWDVEDSLRPSFRQIRNIIHENFEETKERIVGFDEKMSDIRKNEFIDEENLESQKKGEEDYQSL